MSVYFETKDIKLNVNAKELKEESIELSILFAEDEPELRESVTKILEKFFKKVYSVENGLEAFELIKNNTHVDIVLTDLNMPIMDGMELIQMINKSEQELKVIVLTAFNDSKCLEKLINLNIDYFISKPLDKQQLITMLYKAAVGINEHNLLMNYEQNLQIENDELRRKNNVLTQKLNQLAKTTNHVIDLESRLKKTVSSVNTTISSDDFYDSLLQDDIDELNELLIELDSKIALVFCTSGKVTLTENKEFSSLFKRFSRVVNSYQEFYDISRLVLELSAALEEPSVDMETNAQEIGLLIESLLFTMKTFKKNVFDNRIKNPTFYNASLLADITLVKNLLTNNENDNVIEFF